MRVRDAKVERPSALFGAVVLAAALAMGLDAGGQSPALTPVIDVQRLGPQVGETVPSFSLPDHTGVVRTLKDVLGTRGAVGLRTAAGHHVFAAV